jgi:hypothetical protein
MRYLLVSVVIQAGKGLMDDGVVERKCTENDVKKAYKKVRIGGIWKGVVEFGLMCVACVGAAS